MVEVTSKAQQNPSHLPDNEPKTICQTNQKDNENRPHHRTRQISRNSSSLRPEVLLSTEKITQSHLFHLTIKSHRLLQLNQEGHFRRRVANESSVSQQPQMAFASEIVSKERKRELDVPLQVPLQVRILYSFTGI